MKKYFIGAYNKALKLARVARWTPSTGAASHCRAGFSRRLALRYIQMRKIIAKIPILLLLISIDSSAICLEESKKVKIHIKVESCKLVKFEDYPELIKAEKYLTSENRTDDLKSLKKDYEGIVIYYYGEPYFYKTKEENACEKFVPNSEHFFIQKYPCCDMTPLAANEEPCGLGINVPLIEPVNE